MFWLFNHILYYVGANIHGIHDVMKYKVRLCRNPVLRNFEFNEIQSINKVLLANRTQNGKLIIEKKEFQSFDLHVSTAVSFKT